MADERTTRINEIVAKLSAKSRLNDEERSWLEADETAMREVCDQLPKQAEPTPNALEALRRGRKVLAREIPSAFGHLSPES